MFLYVFFSSSLQLPNPTYTQGMICWNRIFDHCATRKLNLDYIQRKVYFFFIEEKNVLWFWIHTLPYKYLMWHLNSMHDQKISRANVEFDIFSRKGWIFCCCWQKQIFLSLFLLQHTKLVVDLLNNMKNLNIFIQKLYRLQVAIKFNHIHIHIRCLISSHWKRKSFFHILKCNFW